MHLILHTATFCLQYACADYEKTALVLTEFLTPAARTFHHKSSTQQLNPKTPTDSHVRTYLLHSTVLLLYCRVSRCMWSCPFFCYWKLLLMHLPSASLACTN